MLNRLALLTALFLLTVPAPAAELFRTVDENGEVVYTDRPPAEGLIEPLGIKSAPTDNLRVAERRQAALENRQNELRSDEEAAAEADKQRENQQRIDENCRRAREALASLVSAQRLFVTTDSGERAYLDDDQRTARIARGEADVDEWCNGNKR